jgi:hypothetical protein
VTAAVMGVKTRGQGANRLQLGLLLVASIATSQVHAFPALFLNKNSSSCDQHPSQAFGGHQAPVADM